MKIDWSPLDRELDLWRAEGRVLPLWWRDDDAIEVTPQLEQLHGLAADLGLPLHLAVIPAGATPELAAYVAARPLIVPVVHGLSHRNHAPAGEKKAEFGAHRDLEQLVADCAVARDRLGAVFGNRLTPMFVPPWNRVAPDLLEALPGLGYRAISTFTPRKAPLAAPGLHRINTHLDPIDWKGTRSLVDPGALVAQITGQLQDRRLGRADAEEPYGILTHHLVHDAAIWHFTTELLSRLTQGPVTAWSAASLKTQGDTA